MQFRDAVVFYNKQQILELYPRVNFVQQGLLLADQMKSFEQYPILKQ